MALVKSLASYIIMKDFLMGVLTIITERKMSYLWVRD